MKYGRLTIIQELKPEVRSGVNRRMVLCKCDCGNTKKLMLNSLQSGTTQSCGCQGKENRMKASTKHGLRKHPLYRVWRNMKGRCYNPKIERFPRYGGRGIIICDEWKNNFQAFYNWATTNGYQKGLQIDRINNDGNYEPENCRWVTLKQNGRNNGQTKINNQIAESIRKMKFENPSLKLIDIADYFGISQTQVHNIISNKAWS